MNSGPDWTQSAQQLQHMLGESWSKAWQAFAPLSGAAFAGQGASSESRPVSIDPEKLQQLQQNYLKEVSALWSAGVSAPPGQQDRRFAATAWDHNPLASFSAAAY